MSADLRCEVVAPDGARAVLTLQGDGAGPLVLDVDRPRVLWRSLPQGGGAPLGLLARVLALAPPEVRAELARTDVEVRVAGRVLGSARGGRWRPARAAALVGALSTLAGVVAAVLVVRGAVAGVRRLLQRS